MMFSYLNHKTIAAIVAVSLVSLFGCSQQQPSATVEPSADTTKTVVSETKAEDPKAETLKNLQAAYNGESNAHVMYLEFAEKADEEGYGKVARLFRAAARAEEIHRDNHAKVIISMGATPENDIATPQVSSTGENLEKAIKGESYERDTMYPKFISQAKTAGNEAAVQTFTYATEAEAQHAELYTQALNNLNEWKEATQVIYVCEASGHTTMNADETATCPQSNASQQFEEIL
ncbi:MAG: rubrerythrin family protein [Limnoraphis robusta]|uniref:Rubrerythrin n=2 Tax=Limnoraphis robusta TaxID=1118279 RepID=A0A0F5YCX5_9CYAN|nr:rubrerythrin family protein [Limnoraphis robusta]KKD36731.1 rubrerythrin [Limnoraphis robusta CS-951]MEA5495802.1 rubrerythrin family protein [Limnoraphis robusta BA-68 BA1]MEA5521099.1 rubrerythrin family protein [Limnoraphis robusta CCNP1315]MEA5538508.1 rubrerythrin family protein [Limnoraphis robusta Tam1]MEA5547322.1 rubrerythrin family protein [Limnoraphis robusta CCNP1324]